MFKIRISELKDKITIQIKKDLERLEKDEDGKPVKYKTDIISTRAKIRYLYGKEYEDTKKTENIQKLDFYIRKRKALKNLDTRGVITFNNKDFNIKYINDLGEFLEIRGEHEYEYKN